MLLTLPPEGVKKLIENYEKMVSDIKSNALTLAWYMRGSVTYEDVLNMSSHERKLINQLVEKNLETTKKTKIPFV